MKAHRIAPPDAESDLIRLAKKGDERAFTKLVRTYEGTVYSFAYKVCRDRDKAGETAQDTFVSVYQKLKQFDGRSKFSTWLYAIVTNNCLMKRRKSKLDQAAVSVDEFEAQGAEAVTETMVDDHESPLEHVATVELRQKLDEAITKLGVDYRVVFVLRDIEGLKAEEVAKILKLSIPAVKSRLRRARVFLKNELEPYVSEMA
jgi:RNA polymerase sigma-70 factor, ECF subfamily